MLYVYSNMLYAYSIMLYGHAPKLSSFENLSCYMEQPVFVYIYIYICAA